MNKDCAIFIAARDSFSDIWDVFFTLFFRYWPDCPFPIYLITESKVYADPRLRVLPLPEDPLIPWEKQWVPRMKRALAEIGTPFFIFFHTDYLLRRKVDTGRILELIERLKSDQLGCVRLCPYPAPKHDYPGDRSLGTILKDEDYAVSLQVTLWKQKVFDQFLVDGWGPVDLEMTGSKRSVAIKELFLGVKVGHTAIDYLNGIKKGVWSYEAARLVRREGLQLNGPRRVESLGHTIYGESPALNLLVKK